MKNILILLLLLSPAVGQADHIKFSPGTKMTVQATITIVADSNGELQIDATAPMTIGGGIVPGPITPGPVIPGPTTDLASAVTQASAAVAAYANKDQDRAAMAYVMTFLAPGVQKAEISLGRKTIKDACDQACGANAAKWNNVHAVIAANTANMTNVQYAASLKTIAEALTSSLAASDGDFEYTGGAIEVQGEFSGSFSQETINELMSASESDRYGKLLPDGFLAQLLQMLLPILLKMLLGL